MAQEARDQASDRASSDRAEPSSRTSAGSARLPRTACRRSGRSRRTARSRPARWMFRIFSRQIFGVPQTWTLHEVLGDRVDARVLDALRLTDVVLVALHALEVLGLREVVVLDHAAPVARSSTSRPPRAARCSSSSQKIHATRDRRRRFLAVMLPEERRDTPRARLRMSSHGRCGMSRMPRPGFAISWIDPCDATPA